MTAIPAELGPAALRWRRIGSTGTRKARKLRWALVLLGFSALVVVLGPTLAPHDPNDQDVVGRLAAPSGEHLLGTDELGRDVLSRVIVAARVDVTVGIIGALLPFLLGSLLGAVAGYLGGIVDAAIARVTELVLAFPVYVLAIALVTIMGPGPTSIVVAYTAVGWVQYARLLRVTMRKVGSEEYVDAARLGGVGPVSLIVRHMLPNAMRECLALLAMDVMVVILTLSAFSYLGLGIQPPDAEWGAMVAAGQPFLREQWWLTLAPGVCITIVGLGFVLLGEHIEERRSAHG